MLKDIKFDVQKTADHTPELLEALSALTGSKVMVGVPVDKSARGDTGSITNAQLAYIHNFGAPDANIPQREFMESGIALKKTEIIKALGNAGANVLAGGGKGAVERGLTAVGLLAQSGIQRRITEGPFAPLAESTLAARRRRGRSGDRPLMDTGALRRSITYVIRPVKGTK